ncbi:hypothetical protein DFH09DRAFT_1313465 [Mycena vulgaris]|nr:hypothetical protein DFH09DRAFT_1313465 [Mycena vulgaris]
MRRLSALFLVLLLPFAVAQDGQTLTIPDPAQAGQTIVEVITTDLNGLPSTTILSTVLPTGVTTTLTTTDAVGQTVVEVVTGDGLGDSATQILQTLTTTAAEVTQAPGPVGQPGPTGAAGAPTPYTYTTTDALGETTAVVATFTPSFATTVMPSATFKATVLDYSVYTASYATQQATNQAANSNGASDQSRGWWGLGFGAVISVVGGTILLLGA